MAGDVNKVDQAFEALATQIQGMDFAEFCKIAGVNKTQAVVCMEKTKGLSLGQISVKYGIPKSSLQRVCEKCGTQ